MRRGDREEDIVGYAKNVVQAAGKLLELQGRIARRNARQGVLNRIRRLRDMMDEWFPHQREVAKRRKRVARGHDEKWATVSNEAAINLAGLGIKVSAYNGAFAHAPSWAAQLWLAEPRPPLSDIKRARRNIPLRHALLARVTLQESGSDGPVREVF